jgi:hypothetical protein
MIDEKGTGLSSGNYLFYNCHLRGFVETDPLHRSWNDVKAAARACGLWGAMGKLTLIANVNMGYFSNDENLNQKAEVGNFDATIDQSNNNNGHTASQIFQSAPSPSHLSQQGWQEPNGCVTKPTQTKEPPTTKSMLNRCIAIGAQ